MPAPAIVSADLDSDGDHLTTEWNVSPESADWSKLHLFLSGSEVAVSYSAESPPPNPTVVFDVARPAYAGEPTTITLDAGAASSGGVPNVAASDIDVTNASTYTVAPTDTGLEWTLPDARLDWTLPDARLDWTV